MNDAVSCVFQESLAVSIRNAQQWFLVICFTFSFSISLVDENLLTFSCSFSHSSITQNECDHTSHTVRSTHCCRLSSTRIFTVSYNRLTRSSDEMSTKTARILVLVSVIRSNCRHSFSLVDENLRLLVIVFVRMTKINLFSLTKF